MQNRKKKAPRKIPTGYDDRQIQISDPNLVEVVGAALSQAVFAYKDTAGGLLSHLHRFLRLYANTEIGKGRATSPAPNPEVEREVQGWSRGPARKRLNISAEDEREKYEAERRLDGWMATLPAEFLAEYVPIELWPVIGSIVTDGPVTFERRLDLLLHVERDRTLEPTRRRPEGGYVSGAVLLQLWAAANRVTTALKRQAAESEDRPHRYLEPWRGFQITIKPPVGRATEGTVTDNSPPPTHLARLAYRRINEEIRDELALGAGDSELEAIEHGPYHRLENLFTRIRNRAIFVSLAVLAPRIEELLTTKRRDFVTAYRFSGGVAPALFLKHPKTLEAAAFHPMPAEAAAAIVSYLAFLDRWAKEKNAEPFSDRDPLFIGRPSSRNQIQRGTVDAWFGGSVDERRAGALMPVHPDQPDVGYRPHGMRKRMQLWCSGLEAERWCREHGIEPIRQETIGAACLAHGLKEIAALYRGDSTPEGKERLRFWGASIAWEMLACDLGQRRVPDADGYRAALREKNARHRSLENLEREIETLCSESERTGKHLSPAAVLGRMQKATRWSRELAEVDRVLVEIEAGLPHRLVPIDDEVPDDALPQIDLDVIKEEELKGEPAGRDRRLRRVRNWITPDELGRIIGRAPSTIREWVAKEVPKRIELWDRTNPPIREFAKTRRAILVDGINEAVFDTPEKRAALAECLAQDPPSGWTHFPLMTSRDDGS